MATIHAIRMGRELTTNLRQLEGLGGGGSP
jgi:hypothetical protein